MRARWHEPCHGCGTGGLAAVERERPEVILLDMRMPVLDGRGFARAYWARHDGAAGSMPPAGNMPTRWRAGA
jgi:CheY-like chemotaxis protein